MLVQLASARVARGSGGRQGIVRIAHSESGRFAWRRASESQWVMGEPNPSRSTWWLLALMVLSLVLLVGLVWQALAATRSQLAAAERVLGDYAQLVADEFERRLDVAIGYELFYGDGARLVSRVEAWLDRSVPIDTAPFGGVWSFDGRSLTPLAGGSDPDHINAMLEPLRRALSEQSAAPFRAVHWSRDGEARTVGVFPSGAGHLVLEVDPAELARRVEQVYQAAPLLPPALAAALEGNSGLYLRFSNPAGQTVFRSPARYDPYLFRQRTLEGRYAGLFQGYTLTTSIEPGVAENLVIGGLPRIRLPLMLLLIVMTTAVVGATCWLLLKERALARTRSEFVARVSHELRTPLTQIRMFAETLALGRARDADQAREYLSIIDRESQRLGHLVDNVLTFSRREMTPHQLAIGPVDVSATVGEVLRNYQPLAESHGDQLQAEVQAELQARADREAVSQVLLNFLDNACKYGPRGQTVRVQAWREADQVCVAVEDDGPGVPDSRKEVIWQPYRRLRREQLRALNGTGIGLSVARELVQAMAGSCRVTDASGGGARFELRLPASAG